MATLPAHPDLRQLRVQAKELLRAARSGESAAVDRIHSVSPELNLAGAQLAIAREYGSPSWPALKATIEARSVAQSELVAAFCEASIRDWTGRAARMLAANPQIEGSGFPVAVVLGDVVRVRRHLERDPQLANRIDERTGWTPLHAVCASRWHRLDPARAGGLLAVAQLLLDAGAGATVAAPGQRAGGGWTPLRCAIAGAANAPIAGLLIERGAIPDDHDLYLACFGDDEHATLRLLLAHMPDVSASTALAAPISTGDTVAVRLLLEAGVDPNRPAPAELYGEGHETDPAVPSAYAAVETGAPALLLGLLIEHGADPNAAGGDGLSPIRLALDRGRDDLVEMLLRLGARDDSTEAERFVAACMRADRADAQRYLATQPDLVATLTDDQRAAIVIAAESGRVNAVELLLDLGIPIDTRGRDSGGTALHAAAYAGSAETVRLLLARGADIESRDEQWDSTPLDWASVGSGERPRNNPDADWPATVRVLLAAGASTAGMTLEPEDPKPPSPEVAELLRSALKS